MSKYTNCFTGKCYEHFLSSGYFQQEVNRSTYCCIEYNSKSTKYKFSDEFKFFLSSSISAFSISMITSGSVNFITLGFSKVMKLIQSNFNEVLDNIRSSDKNRKKEFYKHLAHIINNINQNKFSDEKLEEIKKAILSLQASLIENSITVGYQFIALEKQNQLLSKNLEKIKKEVTSLRSLIRNNNVETANQYELVKFIIEILDIDFKTELPYDFAKSALEIFSSDIKKNSEKDTVDVSTQTETTYERYPNNQEEVVFDNQFSKQNVETSDHDVLYDLTENSFTPDVTTENSFTPDVTTENSFTPDVTTENSFTSDATTEGSLASDVTPENYLIEDDQSDSQETQERTINYIDQEKISGDKVTSGSINLIKLDPEKFNYAQTAFNFVSKFIFSGWFDNLIAASLVLDPLYISTSKILIGIALYSSADQIVYVAESSYELIMNLGEYTGLINNPEY